MVRVIIAIEDSINQVLEGEIDESGKVVIAYDGSSADCSLSQLVFPTYYHKTGLLSLDFDNGISDK